MARPRPSKKREPQSAADNKIPPVELRVGDRLSDETGEWEVIAPPYSTAEGRIVHARVQRINEPASWEIRSWDASRRISVKRGLNRPEGRRSSGLGGGVCPPATPTLRSLDVVALTRRVPMGFGNARHGRNSPEEHECENDESLHLDLTPSLSHRLRGRQPTGRRRAASKFGKGAQEREA